MKSYDEYVHEHSSSAFLFLPVTLGNIQEEISRESLQKAFENLDLSKDDVTTDQVETGCCLVVNI
jgi:hypothetical protein